MKYIDADRLRAEIERRRLSNRYLDTEGYEEELLEIIDSLQEEQPITATGRVFTNTDPMNLYVERDQWAAILSQFDNGQRVRIILVKEDAE